MEDNQPEETPTNHLLSLTKFGIDSAGRTENDGPHSTENPARPTGNSRSVNIASSAFLAELPYCFPGVIICAHSCCQTLIASVKCRDLLDKASFVNIPSI